MVAQAHAPLGAASSCFPRGGAIELEGFAVKQVITFQRFEHQEIDRKPNRAAPVRVAPKQTAVPFAGNIIDPKLLVPARKTTSSNSGALNPRRRFSSTRLTRRMLDFESGDRGMEAMLGKFLETDNRRRPLV
jgi:hypothetical protein